MLRAIARKFPNEVVVVCRHRPGIVREFSRSAAIASECAAQAGAFEAYHDLLFDQDSIGAKSWTSLAEAGGGPPGDQDCSDCITCDLCVPGDWGGQACDYKGGDDCKCREIDGNCNPTTALNVEPEDRRIIEADGATQPLVRLAGNVFGSWDCDGELRVAYSEDSEGVLVRVVAADFRFYKSHYGFERYIGLLGDRILVSQQSTLE